MATGDDAVRGSMTTPWGEVLDERRILPEYPRPQLVRDSYLNLNGRWQCEITPVSEPARPEFTREIVVPFSPEAPLSGLGHVLQPDEYLWYRRTFTLPGHFLRDRVILHLGAVDQDCDVWIDGTPVGSHRGGYLPFSFDITDALFREEHEIVVRVRDVTDTSYRSRGKQTLQPGGIWYTPSSGIWQTVWLEAVREQHITGVTCTPRPADDVVEVTVDASQPGTALVRIFAEAHEILAEEVPTGTPTELVLPGARRWSPEDPFLHDVVVTLGEDKVQTYFGMRSIRIGDDGRGRTRLLLNGEPYLQRGLLDQGYWPDGLLTAPSDEALAYDIQVAKELGFNMLRKHVKIEPARWYYHCDRLGMLVWQDMVSGGETYRRSVTQAPAVARFRMKDSRYKAFGRQDAAGREEFVGELERTVRDLSFSPAVVAWVVFNEGWGQFDAKALGERVRELDPTRVVDHASGWHDQGGGDIVSPHVYLRPYRPTAEELDDPRATVLTEYGGYSHGVPMHTWSDEGFGYKKFAYRSRFEQAFLRLQRDEIGPAIQRGLAGFIYTQLTDVERETNGLVTYDRRLLKIDAKRSRATNEALEESFRRSLGREPQAIPVHEREITEPVSLTRPDGTLNPDAVGWTRRPLITTDGIGLGAGLRGTGRNKRWEYWAATTPNHVVAIVISHLDYAGLISLYGLDRASGEVFEEQAILPPVGAVELPGTLGQGRAFAKTKKLQLRIDEVDSGTRIRASSARLSFDIVAHRPSGHEALGVVVPWSEDQFQYTVKDVARPATGVIWIDGIAHDLPKPESFAALDHGRGRWPRDVRWNWGAGAGFDGIRRIGLQVGGKWTDGSGSTENALNVNGKLYKISQELVWDYTPGDWMAPWRVHGKGVDLTFTPFHLRESKIDVKLLSSETYQCFGDWAGSVEVGGRIVEFEGLTGWAEDVRQRW